MRKKPEPLQINAFHKNKDKFSAAADVTSFVMTIPAENLSQS